MASNGNQGGGPQYNSLTQGTKIIGTIVTDNDIRVDGIIEGDLHCKGKVVIGQQGMLKGNIECQNAEILGKTQGKITCHDLLVLRQSSQLTGDVITQTLVVEAKAILNGTCKMLNTPEVENNPVEK